MVFYINTLVSDHLNFVISNMFEVLEKALILQHSIALKSARPAPSSNF